MPRYKEYLFEFPGGIPYTGVIGGYSKEEVKKELLRVQGKKKFPKGARMFETEPGGAFTLLLRRHPELAFKNRRKK